MVAVGFGRTEKSSEKLTRLCTIPELMLSGTWDRTPYAMEATDSATATLVGLP